MSSLLTLAKDLEQQSKAQQKSTGEMLKAAFSEHEQSVRAELNASARRISDAISAHEQSMSEAMEKTGGACCGWPGTWLTILMVSALLIATSGSILWWQGQQITDNYTSSSAGRYPGENDRPDVGSALSGEQRRPEVLILPPGMQAEAIPYDGTTWIRLKQE
jgi:hypothetical protein